MRGGSKKGRPRCNGVYGEKEFMNKICRMGQVRMKRPGEAHPNAKLTDSIIFEIRSGKEPRTFYAEKYKIHPAYVSQIKRRARWSHI